MAAFETQGRFIKSRYGDDPQLAGPGSGSGGSAESEDASST